MTKIDNKIYHKLLLLQLHSKIRKKSLIRTPSLNDIYYYQEKLKNFIKTLFGGIASV